MKALRDCLWFSAAALLAAGCKSGPAPEPETARQGPTANAWRMAGDPRGAAPQRGDTTSPTMGSIRIDERILQACGSLPEPQFELDSAAIRDRAAESLRTVARCFSDGPLKGRRVKLVGRADPRGTETYNLALGQDRAASVARFLEGAGLPRPMISTMSRGEMDATGADEEGWARDRRVDIVLGE
jgi:peptidoglycan-associated lipoprotein